MTSLSWKETIIRRARPKGSNMKKYINYSIVYAVSAMVAGVFYREFTKVMDYRGITMLSSVHPHLFMLGTFLFLIVALFSKSKKVGEEKSFRLFLLLHSTALPLTAIMMMTRGIIETTGKEISKGLSASVSGIAGIGHILLGASLILLLISLKKAKER